MEFLDKATLTGVRETDNGYLVAEVNCARTGIQKYLGSEIGLIDSNIVNVYRDESEVFNKASLASFVGKPVTDDHPANEVTADNWKQYARGQIGEGVLRNGEYIRVPITLMDADTIKKVKDGKVEISMGYSADIEFVDGVTHTGEAYQAKQKNIRINHLAVVEHGRAGSKCRIGDTQWGTSPINQVIGDKQMTTKTVTVDGLTVETTEQGAAAIAKLQNDVQAAAQKLNDANSAHAKEVADKDAEIAKKDAEIEALKDKQLSDADIDKRVSERADLIAQAKALHDADYAGKSTAEIKKIAVAAHVSNEINLDDKSEAYIDARFDVLVENTDDDKQDKFADAMKNNQSQQVNDNGQADYETRTANAWKGVE